MAGAFAVPAGGVGGEPLPRIGQPQVDRVEERCRPGRAQREVAFRSLARQLRREHDERAGHVIAHRGETAERAPHDVGAGEATSMRRRRSGHLEHPRMTL